MKGLLSLLSLAPTACLAGTIASDPSDTIPPSGWAADNSIVPDYNVPFIATQPSPILAANKYSTPTTVDHKAFYASGNDTSVILVNATTFNGSHITVVKSGYSSNLLTASFYGFNAAINVANGSRASMDHVNVTVHNGAANLYAYGEGTVINVKDAWLYSSGPVSHGLYASGEGTIIGRNIKHFSGGFRSSSFAGDSPAGDIYVYDSVAHTQGIGSATYYALGTVHAENVISVAEKGPVVFADGPQNVTLVHCDGHAGLLGGAVYFSSMQRQSGANLHLIDSKITVTGSKAPGLWFGNTIANVTIQSSEIVTDSGVLVVANYSQITQDFDHYAGYSENNQLQPAQVTVQVTESTLRGDIVAYNGSSISWNIARYSSWSGAAYSGYGGAGLQVIIDGTSTWNLTRESKVQSLIVQDRSLKNIHSNGHTLHYDSDASANAWLKGKTVDLVGGGVAQPM
ncbi:hypothetical protein GQ53DRAFT_817084 [Thozetella sp. PMI_491]|nr:hypothetical protein GQ53DRAFT_817084 [Thozetella sp. PMI_491]